MNETIVISLAHFSEAATAIAKYLGADLCEYDKNAFRRAFERYRSIVALMSAGIAVRGIAPLLKDKWRDPVVVVVTPDLRFAVPLVGGHHGANELAGRLAGAGIEPVISTATEATGRDAVEKIAEGIDFDVVNRESTRAVNAAILDSKIPVYAVKGPGIVIADPGVSILVKKGEYVVGIGCRRGITAAEVRGAVEGALTAAGIGLDEIFVFATTMKKRHERGLSDAVASLSGNLVYLEDEAINAEPAPSGSRAPMIGLTGVAEPCALHLSRHQELVVEKKIYGGVTIAVAR